MWKIWLCYAFFRNLEWGHFRWRNFFKKFQKTCLRSSIRSHNWKPHNPSNIYDISAQWHVAFQNLCTYSGSGPIGIGDTIKRKMTQKVTKLNFFMTPRTPTRRQNCKIWEHAKVYFRTLELQGGFEEIPLFWTPYDEIKPTFCPLIRHFFLKKLDVPTLCPISLFRLGLETRARCLFLHTGP